MNAYIIAGFRRVEEVYGRWSMVYGGEGGVLSAIDHWPKTTDHRPHSS